MKHGDRTSGRQNFDELLKSLGYKENSGIVKPMMTFTLSDVLASCIPEYLGARDVRKETPAINIGGAKVALLIANYIVCHLGAISTAQQVTPQIFKGAWTMKAYARFDEIF